MAKSALLMTGNVCENPYCFFKKDFSKVFLYCYKFQIAFSREFAFNFFAVV